MAHRRRLTPTESQEQCALFAWAGLARSRWQELELLYHCPNEGECSPEASAWYARMGLRPGVPDICLPVARGEYHGLYIELKAVKGGRLTGKQIAWLEALNRQGYKAVVCQGAESAIQTITWYLNQE